MSYTFGRRELFTRVAGSALLASQVARSAAKETVTARTNKGQLRGAREEGFLSFKGVPYAGPSDGANRFKAPTKLEPWTGIRDALDYGHQAIQNRDPNSLPGSSLAPTTENCQFLNIWTPALDNRKRPVMFYSHGGGFATGSGGWAENPAHDGSALAKNYDVVVITHNHRLGLMGYLYLGDILGEEYAASGDAGMLDIVQALEWVRDNIAAFGGDPGNVMIWGESGGGAKTSTLLAMPSAKGLYHKASIESGPGIRMIPRDAATATARALLADLGLSDKQARELLKVPTDRLLQFQAKYINAGRGDIGGFGPVVDGHYLPAHPFDPVAPEMAKNIPLIVGTNKDESIFQLEHRPAAEVERVFNLDETALKERVRTALGKKADRTEYVLETMRKSRPGATPTDLFIAITTGMGTWFSSVTLAERKVKQQGAPVYMYRFSYESEVPVSATVKYPMKTPHAMEIVFKFDHPQNSKNAGNRPERFQAAHNMAASWAGFARASKPGTQGVPDWPAYDLTKRATMILDSTCHVENDPFSIERKLWQELA
jgi:para-nitrobenzyl esterase